MGMDELAGKLIDVADVLIAKYNPCHLKETSCLVNDPSPCCINSIFGKGMCPYSKDNKCTNRNLDCKIWFCETAIKNMPTEAYDSFKDLENIAKRYGLVKRPFLGDTNYVGADKP